ncbi:hypothetical protein IFM47457_05580 [Aspergillus lentulus]|nr:hypothetical protein IFM47457_05580 [Aspergillus lentulus]
MREHAQLGSAHGRRRALDSSRKAFLQANEEHWDVWGLTVRDSIIEDSGSGRSKRGRMTERFPDNLDVRLRKPRRTDPQCGVTVYVHRWRIELSAHDLVTGAVAFDGTSKSFVITFFLLPHGEHKQGPDITPEFSPHHFTSSRCLRNGRDILGLTTKHGQSMSSRHLTSYIHRHNPRLEGIDNVPGD